MKRFYIPTALFVVLCLGYLAYVGATIAQLPERVATHFDGGGQPNGWMSRTGYIPFISIMGVALPLLIVAFTFLTRFLPDWMVNLPNKAYWLSPAERPETHAYLFGHTLWLSCLLILLMGGIHYLTVRANHNVPVHLPGDQVGVLIGGFLCCVAVWVIALRRRFRKPRMA